MLVDCIYKFPQAQLYQETTTTTTGCMGSQGCEKIIGLTDYMSTYQRLVQKERQFCSTLLISHSFFSKNCPWSNDEEF